MNEFGDKLKAARKAARYSLQRVTHELARRGIDLDPTTIARWERGLTAEEACTTLTVAALANLYGIELSELSAYHQVERERMLGVLVPTGRWVARGSNPEPTG